MSLYVFGKVGGDVTTTGQAMQTLRRLGDRLSVVVSDDSLEKDDREEIDRGLGSLTGPGVYFMICSNENDPDATELWIETQALAMELLQNEGIDPFVFNLSDALQINFPDGYYQAIAQSRFGELVDGLKSISASAVVAIALVDGGIERVKKGSPDDCITEIFRSLILPWDCSPNTLYVFGRGTNTTV